MNDRLTTLVGAVAALTIFFILIYQPDPQAQFSRPTSEQIGPNGYLGLQRWLAVENIQTESHRRRFDKLTNLPSIPDVGNVLISTMPHLKPFRRAELRALKKWVARGNTVLLLAALDDTPDWTTAVNTGSFIDEFESITSLSLEAVVDEDGDQIRLGRLIGESKIELVGLADHPLMLDVERLDAVTDTISSIWLATPNNPEDFVAQLAVEKQTNSGAIWEIAAGNGQMLISASSSLFTNRMLGKADNARLLANVLDYHLELGGKVIFDDFHQGVTDLYDPKAFYSDERLLHTLLFALTFWLLYMLGTSKRLASPRADASGPQQSDLVRAVGGFMSRKLSPVVSGKMMVDDWLTDLHRHGRIQLDDTVWEQLEAMPLVDKASLVAVRSAYTSLGQGEEVSLVSLHNHIHKLRRILA